MNIPFEITASHGQTYRIRNTSDEAFDLVTVTVEHPDVLTHDLPHEVTFRPGASREFMILGTWETERPVEVLVAWDVHPTPYAIPLPPRI